MSYFKTTILKSLICQRLVIGSPSDRSLAGGTTYKITVFFGGIWGRALASLELELD